MTSPATSPTPIAIAPAVTALKVFVRELSIDAEVGVNPDEYGRCQPLLIDVELDVIPPASCEHIADTVNYETVVLAARALAAEGHCKLIEAFAERLARACLQDPRVTAARIRIQKPQALAPDAAAAKPG